MTKRFRLNEEDRLCILYDNRVLASVGFSEIEAEKIVNKLNEQQATIRRLQDLCGESDAENAKLRQEIKQLKEEEKLYAQEILRLNTLLKQYQSFKDLGGDY